MFRRLFYKLQIAENIGLLFSRIPKEFINIFLLIVLIVTGSFVFASKSFVAAANSPVTTSSTANTTTSISDNTFQINAETSFNASKILYQAASEQIKGASSATVNLCLIPRNGANLKEYVDGGAPLNCYATTANVSFVLNASLDSSEQTYKAALSPQANLSILNTIANNATGGGNYQQNFNQASIANSDSFTISGGGAPLTSTQYFSYLLDQSSVTDISTALTVNNCVSIGQSVAKSAVGIAQTVLQDAGYGNRALQGSYGIQGSKCPTNLKLSNPPANFVFSDAPSSAKGGVVTQRADAPTVFSTANSILSTGLQAGIVATSITNAATSYARSNINQPYSAVYQSITPNTSPLISATATYPTLPFVITERTGGEVSGGIKGPRFFENCGDAQEVFSQMTLAQKQRAGLENVTNPCSVLVNANDPAVKLLRSAFYDVPGTVKDCVRTWYLQGYDCPQISFNKNFLNADQETSFSLESVLGYPSGGANSFENNNSLNQFINQLQPNALAKGNTYTNDSTFNVDFKLSLSSCGVAGACQRIGSSPITGKLGLIGGSAVLDRDAIVNFPTAAKTSDAISIYGNKTLIPPNLYDYAINGNLQYGMFTKDQNSSMLSRYIGSDSKPIATTLYNTQDVNMSRGKELLPLSQPIIEYLRNQCASQIKIAKKIDTLSADQKAGCSSKYDGFTAEYDPRIQSYGNVVSSDLDSSKVFGIVHMVHEINDGTSNPEIYVAYQAVGNSINGNGSNILTANSTGSTYILSAFEISDLSQIPDRSQIVTGDTTLTQINRFKGLDSTHIFPVDAPRAAISVVQDKRTGCSNNSAEVFHGLVDIADAKIRGVPNTTLSTAEFNAGINNYYVRYSNVTDVTDIFDQCKSYVTNGNAAKQIDNFGNPANWSLPVKVIGRSTLVTPTDLQTNSNGGDIYIISSDPFSNTISLVYGNASANDTTWFQYDPNSTNGTSFQGYDLNAHNYDLTGMNYLKITAGIPQKRSYSMKISQDGVKTLFIADTDKGDLITYQWRGMYPTKDELNAKQVFNVYSLSSRAVKPANMQLVTSDVAPIDKDGVSLYAVGINLNYQNITVEGAKKNYTIPVVIQQNKDFGFQVYEFDQYKSQVLFNDQTDWNRQVADSGKTTMNPRLMEVKWTTTNQLGYLMNFIGNMTRVGLVERDFTDLYTHKCTDGRDSSYFFGLSSSNGTLASPNCNGGTSRIVENSPIFGTVVSMSDRWNLTNGRYAGYIEKLTATQEYDFHKYNAISQQTALTESGSSSKPSNDYAEELWGVSNDSILVGSKWKGDASDNGLKTRLTDYVVKKTGRSSATVRSQIDKICNIAANANIYQNREIIGHDSVACTLLIAIWGAESSFGKANGQFNCGVIGTDEDLTNQAQCAADTMVSKYFMFTNKGVRTQTGNATKQTIKFDNAFDLAFSYYVPIDLRLFDPNGQFTWNQCNKGLVIRADQNTSLACVGDTQVSGDTYPHAPATDTRITHRTFLYGDGPLISGNILPLNALDHGDVTSVLDPRIILTKNIYTGSTSSVTVTAVKNIHINTSQIAGLVALGDNCEAARSSAKTTSLNGISVIDFTDTMKTCLGTAATSEPINRDKPTFIVMHYAESGSVMDYVNISEMHKYSFNITSQTPINDPKFQWNEPTYHVYVRKDGSIEQGQDFTKQSVHANGSCGGTSCNQVSVGISLEGSYDDPPSSAALQSAVKLVKYLQNQYQINTQNVVGHCEVQAEKEDTIYQDIQPSGISKSGTLVQQNRYCLESSKIFRDKYIGTPVTQIDTTYKASLDRRENS